MRTKTHARDSSRGTMLTARLLFAGLISLLVCAAALAQAQRPTPTPQRDLPVIVSRDADLDDAVPAERDGNEVVDGSERDDTIELPAPTEPASESDASVEPSSQAQKRMLLYLDLLTKTEQRAATLRRQVFELLEKQNDVSAKLRQLEYLLRPEVISATTALSGSLRPEDLRDQRRESLEAEKAGLETMLRQIEASRSGLEDSLRKAELLVERIRAKFETAVEAALDEEDRIVP